MSFDFQKQYAFDAAKSNEGVLIQHPESGIWFRIARSSNRGYRAAVAAFAKANKKKLEAETIEAAEFAEKHMIELRARHILTGWEGTVPYGGEKLSYSEANAIKLLALEGFGTWVMEQADTNENYRLNTEEDEKK